MRSSPVTDWEYSVLEVIEFPKGCSTADYLTDRESYWIAKLNSIEAGFNTARPSAVDRYSVQGDACIEAVA